MRSVRGIFRVIPLVLAVLLVGATQPPTTVPTRTTHPLVGFTFVPGLAAGVGYQPVAALAQLHELHPDLVRIPIYWSSVAPTPVQLDFTTVDELLATVTASNSRRHAHQTQVILVTGVRNLAWPEVHVPDWVDTGGTLDLQTFNLATVTDYPRRFGL